MSKILVTGHRGWIGTNFVKLLDQQGIDWVGVDRIEGDDLLHSFHKFVQRVQDCDVVVHLAAIARIPPSWERYDYYRNNNITVTDKIARICTDQGKHLIYASSSSVVGNGDGPLNPYSWSKLAGEQSIEMYGRSRGLSYTNLRFFTNYGEDDPSGLVIGRWIKQARLGQSITVRGTGKQSRDFIHVSDTARALLACCQQQPKQQTLDIGTGLTHQIIDVAQHLKTNIVYEQELDGYAACTQANIAKTQQYLDWQAQINLIDWIQSQI